MSSTKLELVRGQWYGWQMLPGYGHPYSPYFSPIRVERVEPRKLGRRVLGLWFHNALYADGVQDFQMDLRMLKHEEGYLIAEPHDGSTPDRAIVISRIDSSWLERFCPRVAEAIQARNGAPMRGEELSAGLDAVFRMERRRVGREA